MNLTKECFYVKIKTLFYFTYGEILMRNKRKFTFKTPKRKQPVYNFFRPILTNLVCRKLEVINLNEEISDKSIFVGNHEGKKGPLMYERYIPKFLSPWGAYQMLGGYTDRYKYLRNVLYIQKMSKGKFSATLKSCFEAIFSILIYRGIKVIPSFPDARLFKTLNYSMDVLDNNMAVMVYPEDSNNGYLTEPTKFFNGFVMLGEYYYKKRGEDVPVYPTYLSLKTKKLVIGKPLFINELKNQGLSKDEIAERFRVEVVNLYREYVKEK